MVEFWSSVCTDTTSDTIFSYAINENSQCCFRSIISGNMKWWYWSRITINLSKYHKIPPKILWDKLALFDLRVLKYYSLVYPHENKKFNWLLPCTQAVIGFLSAIVLLTNSKSELLGLIGKSLTNGQRVLAPILRTTI